MSNLWATLSITCKSFVVSDTSSIHHRVTRHQLRDHPLQRGEPTRIARVLISSPSLPSTSPLAYTSPPSSPLPPPSSPSSPLSSPSVHPASPSSPSSPQSVVSPIFSKSTPLMVESGSTSLPLYPPCAECIAEGTTNLLIMVLVSAECHSLGIPLI